MDAALRDRIVGDERVRHPASRCNFAGWGEEVCCNFADWGEEVCESANPHECGPPPQPSI